MSKIYGPHPKSISYQSKKNGWIKGGIIEDVAIKTREYLTKSGAQINIEYDSYYEKLTEKIATSIEKEELTPTDTNFHVGSLKTIRQERQEIRGEVTAIQERKFNLDLEKFEHKKEIDYANLELKRVKKNIATEDDESDVEYVD